MISDILSITDRLYGLLIQKKENRKIVFEKVFEPIFAELSGVHDEYMNIFNTTYEMFRNKEIPLQVAVDHLKNEQYKSRPARDMLSAFGSAFNEKKEQGKVDHVYERLVEILIEYLSLGLDNFGDSAKTLAEFLDNFDKVTKVADGVVSMLSQILSSQKTTKVVLKHLSDRELAAELFNDIYIIKRQDLYRELWREYAKVKMKIYI